MRLHYEEHHANYIEALNKAIVGTDYAGSTLDGIVKTSFGRKDWRVFHNSAQHYNHSLYWRSLSSRKTAPGAKLKNAIIYAFGNWVSFQTAFCATGTALFGSGWVWLVKDPAGHLRIVPTKDADTPIVWNWKPLLVVDVWEHAYSNRTPDRKGYLFDLWPRLNWTYASQRFER